MALASTIKVFCFVMELHGDKYNINLEVVTPLKCNSMYDVPQIIRVIAHLYIWLQLTKGKSICQYGLLIYFPTNIY